VDLTNQRLGPYKIDREIGRGGMAIVYRAIDTRDQSGVALKVLLPHHTHDKTTVRRFIQEGESTRQLRHPNIVKIYEAGMADGYYFIAMQFASRGTLADELKLRTHPMTVDEALPVLEQIAAALDYAHARGILHRDVKPSNVLLDDNGVALLSDFGVARHLSPDQTMVTLAGYAVGTPAYMSPEQARGDPDISHRSDVYSFGVLAYVMLTGELPYDATSQLVLLRKIIDDAPAPAESINKTLTPGVAYALRRVMAKDLQFRYASAGEFVVALERGKTWRPGASDWKALETAINTTPRQVVAGQPPLNIGSSHQRNSRSSYLLLALILIIAAAGGLLWANSNDMLTAWPMIDQLLLSASSQNVTNTPPLSASTASNPVSLTPSASTLDIVIILTPTPTPTFTPTVEITPVTLSQFIDPGGRFQIALPSNWLQTQSGDGMEMRDPGELAFLFIRTGNDNQANLSAEQLIDRQLVQADLDFSDIQPGVAVLRQIGDQVGIDKTFEASDANGRALALRVIGITGESPIVVGVAVNIDLLPAFTVLFDSVFDSFELLPTPTPAPTDTPTPTSTSSGTPTPTITFTATPAASPTPTIQPTETPTTVVSIDTEVPGLSSLVTVTPTAMLLPTVTPQPVPPTSTSTSAPTFTPTVTPTRTPTPNLTLTTEFVNHQMATWFAQTLTAMPTATGTPTLTPSLTATASPSPTRTPTRTPTVTPTPTPNLYETLTAIAVELTRIEKTRLALTPPPTPTPDLFLTLTAIAAEKTRRAPTTTPDLFMTLTVIAAQKTRLASTPQP
jgi:serine/threonine protein kinase